MDNIYLDNAATTKVKDSVLSIVSEVEAERWGNPSAQYQFGKQAKKLLNAARRNIAECIGADADEIFFTSGATEANNLAMRIAKNIKDEFDTPIILSAIEHHSVLNAPPLFGTEVGIVGVDENCAVNIEALREAINATEGKPGVLSVMAVNNETGAIQPISQIGQMCRDGGWVYHCDATQAIGKFPINVKEMNIDMLSASGHKIGAFKGTGFIYIDKRLHPYITPIIFGGAQQDGARGGTEPVSLYYGLSVAVEEAISNMERNRNHYAELATFARAFLRHLKVDYTEHCTFGKTDSIMNIAISGINADALVLALDTDGVCVSQGSACDSEQIEPSHVLTAMGVDKKEALSSIRISFSEDTTQRMVWKALRCLSEEIKNIQGTDLYS